MGVNRDDVINDIRAVLISTSGGISEKTLIRDYRSLISRDIPFRELGFNSLLAFLRSVDGLRVYSGAFGEYMIDAVPDEKTGHISSLVSRTRTKKSKGASRSRRGPSVVRRPAPSRASAPIRRSFPLTFAAPRAAPPSRAPPASQYKYPPIVPQRQPLSDTRTSVQSRLTNAVTPQAAVSVEPAATNGTCISPTLSDSSCSSSSLNSSISGGTRPNSTGAGKPSVDLNKARANIVTVRPNTGPFSPNDRSKKWLSKGSPKNKQDSGQVRTAVNGVSTPPATTVRTPPLRLKSVIVQPPQSLPMQAAYVCNKPRMRLTEQKVVFKSKVEELEHWTMRLGLALPVYKLVERKPSHEKPVFTGVVTIGTDKFTSYPDELPTREQAQELVASLALEKMKQKSAPVFSTPLDEAVLIDRVKNIVGDRVNGMYNRAVEDSYKQMHGEDIPPNWLDVVCQCSVITVERFSEKTVILYPVTEVSEKIIQLVKPKDPESFAVKQVSEDHVDPTQLLSKEPREHVPVSRDNKASNVQSARQSTKASADRQVVTLPSTEASVDRQVVTLPSTEASADRQVVTLPSTEASADRQVVTLPKLKLPDDNMWEVFVSSASINDIWVRLIGDDYDIKYNEAMNDMEIKLMTSDGNNVSNPIVNEFYQVKFDNCWSRVQLVEIFPDSDEFKEPSAEVFLIDNGETDWIKLSDLRELDEEVRGVPPQAIQCRLACVDMQDKEVQNHLLNKVIGNSYVASVLLRPTEDCMASVILYNTVNDPPENINVKLCNMVIEGVTEPKLPQKGGLAEMCISHAEDGLVFVQLNNRNFQLLNLILEDLNLRDFLSEFAVAAYPTLKDMESSSGVMFLVRSKKAPNRWRRGNIVGVENHNRPIVYFVDYGYKETVMISDMFKLEKVFPPLCNFPKQAVEVQLSQIAPKDLIGGVVLRLQELAPSNLSVLGKVVDNVDQFPVVEFFKRVQPDNLIVSINTNLSFNLQELINAPIKAECQTEPELRLEPLSLIDVQKCSKDGSVLTSERRELLSNGYSENSSMALRDLQDTPVEMNVENRNGTQEDASLNTNADLIPFTIPDPGPDFFDVVVTLSSNPSNFVVQPLSLAQSSFFEMMEEMQDYYEENENKMPVPSYGDLFEGTVFAGKHPDDLRWYRVILLAKINSTLVSVRFCDYGDINLIHIDRLRYLDRRFKSLPYLAIRAKLHGVSPKSCDWSVEECLKFNEMVNNASFVSKIIEKNADASDNEWEVSLQLFDTSGSDDKDIAEELIALDVAVRV